MWLSLGLVWGVQTLTAKKYRGSTRDPVSVSMLSIIVLYKEESAGSSKMLEAYRTWETYGNLMKLETWKLQFLGNLPM